MKTGSVLILTYFFVPGLFRRIVNISTQLRFRSVRCAFNKLVGNQVILDHHKYNWIYRKILNVEEENQETSRIVKGPIERKNEGRMETII